MNGGGFIEQLCENLFFLSPLAFLIGVLFHATNIYMLFYGIALSIFMMLGGFIVGMKLYRNGSNN